MPKKSNRYRPLASDNYDNLVGVEMELVKIIH